MKYLNYFSTEKFGGICSLNVSHRLMDLGLGSNQRRGMVASNLLHLTRIRWLGCFFRFGSIQ
jgi:hypothetical protein